MAVEIDQGGEPLGKPEQIFRGAFVHLGEMNVQRLGQALLLALPKLRNHVLDDVFLSHGE